MKRKHCKCLLLTILLWAVWANVPYAAREHQAIVAATANNALGFDLFQQIVNASQGQNVFLSPYSISSALAMTYAGARGKTASAGAKAAQSEEWRLLVTSTGCSDRTVCTTCSNLSLESKGALPPPK